MADVEAKVQQKKQRKRAMQDASKSFSSSMKKRQEGEAPVLVDFLGNSDILLADEKIGVFSDDFYKKIVEHLGLDFYLDNLPKFNLHLSLEHIDPSVTTPYMPKDDDTLASLADKYTLKIESDLFSQVVNEKCFLCTKKEATTFVHKNVLYEGKKERKVAENKLAKVIEKCGDAGLKKELEDAYNEEILKLRRDVAPALSSCLIDKLCNLFMKVHDGADCKFPQQRHCPGNDTANPPFSAAVLRHMNQCKDPECSTFYTLCVLQLKEEPKEGKEKVTPQVAVTHAVLQKKMNRELTKDDIVFLLEGHVVSDGENTVDTHAVLANLADIFDLTYVSIPKE